MSRAGRGYGVATCCGDRFDGLYPACGGSEGGSMGGCGAFEFLMAGNVHYFTVPEPPGPVIVVGREEQVVRLWLGFCIKPQESFARNGVCAGRARDCLQEELTDLKLHSCITPAMGVRVSLWFRVVGIWLPCAVRSFFYHSVMRYPMGVFHPAGGPFAKGCGRGRLPAVRRNT